MAESMTGLKRTHRCAELSEANIGEKVTIMGWVQKNRNKGGLVFVDVRDRSGLIQVVFEEGSTDKALLEKAAKLRSEFVVAIVGTVEKRSGAVNENLATGAIEIKPEELRILSESETPPFPIEENSKTKEEVRLKYRFLDLRRPDIQRNLMMRSRVATLARQFMAKEGFLEIETPFLIKSTPEGARDYLVPSRVHPGEFYGLPQSPQLFKQLLMCSGFDRYYQIAKCFRDEDLRAEHPARQWRVFRQVQEPLRARPSDRAAEQAARSAVRREGSHLPRCLGGAGRPRGAAGQALHQRRPAPDGRGLRGVAGCDQATREVAACRCRIPYSGGFRALPTSRACRLSSSAAMCAITTCDGLRPTSTWWSWAAALRWPRRSRAN